MKNSLLLLSAITFMLASCGGSGSDKAETSSSASTAPAATEQPEMSGGQLLIAKSDCSGCHHKENKIIGPAYQAVAEKYAANEENINYLAGKIIKGGKGVWGTIPMTPHTKISEDDAKQMVTYILSLKK